MANCAIVGINWGDEGKGRMVDYLSQRFDVVVRYQGGGNAGHTVINNMGKFALHLLPSGVFHKGVMNILGNGVALDCENLLSEIETLRAAGVPVSPENLLVSDRASLLLPWHRELDALEEARLKDKQYGSTKQGIAPFYSDKYQKKTIQAGELLYPEHLKAHLQDLLECPPRLLECIPADSREGLLGVLAGDPRPRYQEDPQRVYGMGFAGQNVRFTVDGETLTVHSIDPLEK